MKRETIVGFVLVLLFLFSAFCTSVYKEAAESHGGSGVSIAQSITDPAWPPAAPSYYCVPATETFNTNTARIGTLFNVNVTASCINGTDMAVVAVSFNASLLQVVNATTVDGLGFSVMTSTNPSGGSTYPCIFSNSLGWVAGAGGICYGSGYLPATTGVLCSIWFNITAVPGPGVTLSCNIDPAYGISLSETAFAFSNGTSTFNPNTAPCAYSFAWALALSSTLVSCSPNPVSVGTPVTCTAIVSGSNPTGTITWSTSSSTGSFNQSVCTLSSGACSTTYSDNLTGCVTIAASYSGDSNNAPSSGSTTLTVTSGPVYYSQNYTSVQAAINNASSEATVIVAPGLYAESLTINKTLTIIGEKDPAIFSGGASAIYLTLDSGASGSIVTGIEITNYAEGIFVDNASNCSIYGNIMYSIGSSGVVLDGSGAADNVVFDNVFQDTPTPISLTDSAGGNTIYGNIITSQANVTLNIGANGNVVYGNSMSGTQILLNVTNSNNNIFYSNNFLATVQLTVLATGNNSWNDSSSGGNYWSDYQTKYPSAAQVDNSGIWNTPYVINTNNTDYYPLMNPWTASTGHCVEVLSVTTTKTVVGQGLSANMTVCVADNGEYAESFNVTAYANSVEIVSQQVSLNASCQTVLRFAWNTTGLAYGNYTISAYAQPVSGETNMANNNCTGGWIFVAGVGDISNPNLTPVPDGVVNIWDLLFCARAYMTTPGMANWNPNADITSPTTYGVPDGVVNIWDLLAIARHYMQSYTY